MSNAKIMYISLNLYHPHNFFTYRYKKQQFVILSDSAKVMLNDFDLKSLLDYLKSDENFQIIAILASKVKHIEEYCSVFIMKRQDRCIILSKL